MTKIIDELKLFFDKTAYLFKYQSKLFIPFIFFVIALAGIYNKTASIFNGIGTDSFADFLFGTLKGTFLFSLMLCPVIVIINLWALNLLKQYHNLEEVSIIKTFFKAIGWKFFVLIPFMLIWLLGQLFFVFILLFFAFLSGLSRGAIGGSAIGKLINIILLVSLLFVFLLFLITPGMVLENVNPFRSLKNMYSNIKMHSDIIRTKLGVYMLSLVVVFFVSYYTSFAITGVFLLLSLYMVQIKAGQFYLWAKEQHAVSHEYLVTN